MGNSIAYAIENAADQKAAAVLCLRLVAHENEILQCFSSGTEDQMPML
jgi:hypothetical protein